MSLNPHAVYRAGPRNIMTGPLSPYCQQMAREVQQSQEAHDRARVGLPPVPFGETPEEREARWRREHAPIKGFIGSI